MKVDDALELLRINTPESLAKAEEILGVRIKRCPPALMPWPPKPAPAPRAKRVRKVGRSPHAAGTPAAERFAQVRVGLTVDQLAARGVSHRDLAQWTKAGVLEVR